MDMQDKLAMLAVLPLPEPVKSVACLVSTREDSWFEPAGVYFTKNQLLAYAQAYANQVVMALTKVDRITQELEWVSSLPPEQQKAALDFERRLFDMVRLDPIRKRILLCVALQMTPEE